jgi:pimeloyl-ACP methyl ester carboxylesterase
VSDDTNADSDDSLVDAAVIGFATGRQWAQRAAAAIEASGDTLRARTVTTPRWSWLEIDLFDQPYPLSIDIVASNLSAPRGVVYMLPGGAMNFRASFMVPPEDNLAHFFRRHGYLVVGISPREDTVPADTKDTSFMEAWGMTQHREDIRKVVSLVQSVVPLPYELLGHSYGAASALDYAAAYPGDAARVMALDIYSFDPSADNGAMRRARRTYAAYLELQSEGVHADTSYADFSTLAREGLAPVDGGAPHTYGDEYLRYTSKQMLLFGMIYSAVLPGVHSDITGLPGDWPMAMSTVAADDGWEFRPSDDNSTFSRTSLATLLLAADELGGGLVSMAFARDYWSVVSMVEGAHELPWAGIAGDVVWLNSELGYHEQMYGAGLIVPAAGARVETAVIPGYGHADMLWSQTARTDVWQRLLPTP